MNNHFFELIEFTSRSVFLTGKAGTGKTTFLNEFVKKTKKKHYLMQDFNKKLYLFLRIN